MNPEEAQIYFQKLTAQVNGRYGQATQRPSLGVIGPKLTNAQIAASLLPDFNTYSHINKPYDTPVIVQQVFTEPVIEEQPVLDMEVDE